MGEPGITQKCLDSFIYYLGQMLIDSSLKQAQVLYLRIILVPTEPDDETKNFVYYEVGFPHISLITNGCTDFSGEGGRGKQILDSVISFLSRLFQIKIEKIIIDFPQAQEGSDYLNKYCIIENFILL